MRLRSRIEHGYRFDQEQGMDVEDLRVRTRARIHQDVYAASDRAHTHAEGGRLGKPRAFDV